MLAALGGGKRFFLGAFSRGCRSNLLVDVGNEVSELPIVLDQLLIAGFLRAEFFFELSKSAFATRLFAFEFRTVLLFGSFDANQFLLRFIRFGRHDFDVLAAIGQAVNGAVLFAGHVLQDGRHTRNVVGIVADEGRLPRVTA